MPARAGGHGGNELALLFDAPVCVSLIRFFNYSKTPARGAAAVEVWLDGVAVFCGDLAPAEPAAAIGAGAGAGASAPRPCSSVAFTRDADLVGGDVARGFVRYCGAGAQDVVCFNDGRIVGRVSAKAALALRAAAAAGRGGAAADRRPATAVVAQRAQEQERQKGLRSRERLGL